MPHLVHSVHRRQCVSKVLSDVVHGIMDTVNLLLHVNSTHTLACSTNGGML